jgi:hypothetical protein
MTRSRLDFDDIGKPAKPTTVIQHPIAYACGCVFGFTVARYGWKLGEGQSRLCADHRKELDALALWDQKEI